MIVITHSRDLSTKTEKLDNVQVLVEGWDNVTYNGNANKFAELKLVDSVSSVAVTTDINRSSERTCIVVAIRHQWILLITTTDGDL